MTASVEFMGTQRNLTGTSSMEISITDFPAVSDVLEHISGLYPSLYINKYNTMITVNDEISPADRILQAGDKIVFLPVIGGG
ncbi:MAG: MoaD/ThiS family protein [Dehalococcoidales bacterium]|nr:MAG: MoaD/ThiS family protein [Dehalococcoidales bacterium]